MSVLTRENFLNTIKERIGDDSSDEAISFIQDMTDTFDSFNNPEVDENGKTWKQRYEENDNDWRNRYKERFFSKSGEETFDKDNDEPEVKTFDDLFKKG